MKLFSKKVPSIYRYQQIGSNITEEEFQSKLIDKLIRKYNNIITKNKKELDINIYDFEEEFLYQQRWAILKFDKMTVQIYDESNKVINDFIKSMKYNGGGNLTLIVVSNELNDILEQFLNNTSVMFFYGKSKITKIENRLVFKIAYIKSTSSVYIGGCDCSLVDNSEYNYKYLCKKVKKLITNNNKE